MALDRHAASAYAQMAKNSPFTARGVFNSKVRGYSNQALKAADAKVGLHLIAVVALGPVELLIGAGNQFKSSA
jgi:hypothetical protein